MPLRLDIKRKLTVRSDRVKCVDQHPTEPWLLCSLYNGDVNIWNHETQTQIKKFEGCNLPVRAGKFVPRKNWVLTGSDDMQIRVYNYNTLERSHSFEAHSDYIRDIAVHPTQPFILTSSDDMTIKLWNWDRSWLCQQIFEGHVHYVMQIVINPKDTNSFASASLDRTVKVWQLGSSSANFTLEGHEKGLNCIDYYHGGDKPYLISGADDRMIKIWDYQTKSCVQTLEGHAMNVSAVKFHPELPILITGSEDGTVRIWHSGTYRLESTLNYGLERVWNISCIQGSNDVALGYDEGMIMIKVGREEPAISMDINGGKIVWARHCEIQQGNLKAMPEGIEIKDGQRLPLVIKDMGSCEIFPQTIAHSPNGRFVVVCGDGEYIIYTAMALRNKAYGSAQEFVWSTDSSEYATLENSSTIKVFKNFKEKKSFKPDYGADGIFGGTMLGVRSVSGAAFSFYDWETLDLIRRIEIQPKSVYWSENGNLVCLATDESFFILQCDAKVIANAKGDAQTEDGIENAFEVLNSQNEVVKTGLWVGDCFIYTNSVNRVNYYVGGEIVTITHLDHPMYLLGYIPKQNSLYLCDKELNVVSYTLLLSVLEYQTALLRQDFEVADQILPTVPKEHRTRLAHFLEKHGFRQQALAISTDPEHRFDLALAMSDMDMAIQLAEVADSSENTGGQAASEARWQRLATLASSKGNMDVLQVCFRKANDYPGYIALASATGDQTLLREAAESSHKETKYNVAFMSYFLLGELDKCVNLMIETDRMPEAAFFCRSYLPSRVSEVVQLWQAQVSKQNSKTAQSLANPAQYENLFPGFQESLQLEHNESDADNITSPDLLDNEDLPFLVKENVLRSTDYKINEKKDYLSENEIVEKTELINLKDGKVDSADFINEQKATVDDKRACTPIFNKDEQIESADYENDNMANFLVDISDNMTSTIREETTKYQCLQSDLLFSTEESSAETLKPEMKAFDSTPEQSVLHSETDRPNDRPKKESESEHETPKSQVKLEVSDLLSGSIATSSSANDSTDRPKKKPETVAPTVPQPEDVEFDDYNLSHISFDDTGDDILDDIPDEEFLAMMSDMNNELEKS